MRELVRCAGCFGTIRVLERKIDGARLYCVGSSMQTLMLADGVSAFGYVHAIKMLIASARNVLMIGGGGGSLATMLARRGCAVTVLDVDPAAEGIARRYFHLPDDVRWCTTDPFDFIAHCDGAFDAAVIDACDAEGLVRPFNDPHVLAMILEKACPAGSLVVNLICSDGPPHWGEVVATKLKARGLSATLFRSTEGWEGNEILHVRTAGPTDQLTIADICQRPVESRSYLLSLQPCVPGLERKHTHAKD